MQKIVPLLKAIDRFFSCFHFLQDKTLLLMKMTNDYVSGIWFPDCSKLARNCSVNDFIVCQYEGIIKVFDTFFLFLLTILVTGPSFMSIS